MHNRAPWALTCYFVFMLCLLLWGRLPNDAACYNAGIRMLDSGMHQSISARLPAPYCPACDNRNDGAAHAAVPSTLFGGPAGKDGKGGSAPGEAHSVREPAPLRLADARPAPAAAMVDPRLASLRTVVLRH